MKINQHQSHLTWAACIALLLLGFAAPVMAADPKPPGKMSFQGFLMNSSGEPRGLASPQNITVTFRLYNVPNGGAAIWGEQQVVTVDKGHFSVVLGEGTPAAPAPSSDDLSQYFVGDNENGRFLGVTISGETEITPRIQFFSAPYAHLARYATELVGSSGSSLMKVTDNKVGIGLAANVIPASALDVAGTITATGLQVNGNANATAFIGDGAGLTGINPNNIAGTIPDGKIPSTIARRNAENTFTANQRFTGDLLMENTRTLQAKNSIGGIENFMWPRWNDNIMYMNYGSGGFNIRNNDSTPTMFMTPGGNVGIGTTSPGARLHIVEQTGTSAGLGTGTIILDHENNGGSSSILFRSKVNRFGHDYAFIQYQDSRAGGFAENSLLTIANYNDGDDDIALMPAGNIGINTTAPAGAKLVVNGVGTTDTYGLHSSFTWGGVSGPFIFSYATADVSIKATHAVHALYFRAVSDERIKDIKGRSDAAADLALLNKIEITDYTMKDKISRGDAAQKKVIGQQVESVFPQAVKQTTDIVPDIYKTAEAKGGWLKLASDLKAGDRVRLVAKKSDETYEVVEVKEGAFRAKGFNPADDEKVFVYGREVKDFRTVDYEAIAMLNVSATQELARQVAALKESQARVAELEKKVTRMETLEAELTLLKKLVAEAGLGRAKDKTVAAAGQ